MRKLFIIRIVHTLADMGSMGADIKKESVEKFGETRWMENQAKIDKFWDDVAAAIDGMGLDYMKTRVYQDGLPCGGDLGRKIVNETAEKGSKNYIIVRDLMRKGAIVEATESPQLLLKEFNYIKSTLAPASPEERQKAERAYSEVKDTLLKERDEYIAKGIDTSLKDGETGILFIGAAHDVASKLPADIEVKALN